MNTLITVIGILTAIYYLNGVVKLRRKGYKRSIIIYESLVLVLIVIMSITAPWILTLIFLGLLYFNGAYKLRVRLLGE